MYNCTVKEIIPVTNTYHFLLHEAISPSLSLPCCFPQYLHIKDKTEVMKKAFWAALDSLQLAKKFLQQPRLYMSLAALQDLPGHPKLHTFLSTSAPLLTENKSKVGQFLLLWNALNSYHCWQLRERTWWAYTAHWTEEFSPNLYCMMLPPEEAQMRNGDRQLHFCAAGSRLWCLQQCWLVQPQLGRQERLLFIWK